MPRSEDLNCKLKILSENKTNPVEGSSVSLTLDIFIINVFFDGTWNNKENNNLYRGLNPEYKLSSDKKEALKQKQSVDKGLSYHREATTVEWLFKSFQPKCQINIAVYIEGTGTLDKDKDGAFAAGSGWGSDRGFEAKLQRAFDYIAKELKNNNLTGTAFDILQFNIYGFSRGAASARYFANRLRDTYIDHVTGKEKYYIEKFEFKNSPQPCQVQLGFVGILDTVASVGLKQDNDAKEWKQALDQPNPQIEQIPDLPRGYKVVHIVAANEARTYFSLYNIKSAMDKGYGVEFALPGCHTDIGGGLGALEELVDDEVVVVGKNEVVNYVHEQHNGNLPKQDNKHFNSEGDHDEGGGFFDNVLSRLLRQKIAASQVDAKKLSDAMIEMGYYDEDELITNLSSLPNYKANLAGSKLYLIDNSSNEYGMGEFDQTSPKIDRLLSGYRHQISSGYPRVICNLMLDFIKKYNVDYFPKFKNNIEAQIPDSFLQGIYEKFKEQAMAHDDECKAAEKWTHKEIQLSDKADSRKLFKNYLHWSGDGELMDAQIQQWGEAVRTIYNAQNTHTIGVNDAIT